MFIEILFKIVLFKGVNSFTLSTVPPHAPLASLVWDPGSSVRMPQNAPSSVPSTPTPTIRLGYVIQFARRPPKFNGILEMSVAVRNAPVLREEIAVLLAKDAIQPVPPAEMRQGFHSPYFIVPKKGQQPILNRALHKLPFKMLTRRCIIKCIQPQDWAFSGRLTSLPLLLSCNNK